MRAVASGEKQKELVSQLSPCRSKSAAPGGLWLVTYMTSNAFCR